MERITEDFDAMATWHLRLQQRLELHLKQHVGRLEEIHEEMQQHRSRVNPWTATSDSKPLCYSCAVLPVRDPDDDFSYMLCHPCATMNERASEAYGLCSIAPYREQHDGFSIDFAVLEDLFMGESAEWEDFPLIELVTWHESLEVLEAWRHHNISDLARDLGVDGWPDVPRIIWEQPIVEGAEYLAQRFVETLFQFAPKSMLQMARLADPEYHSRRITNLVGGAHG